MARRSRRRSLRPTAVQAALLLDAEGLSRAARGDVRARAEITLAEQLGVGVHVSAVTLAETLRGRRRDAPVHALLAGVELEAVTPNLGRAAGELLGRTELADTVDAIVAVTAGRLGDRIRILTGDPRDLRALTAEMPGVVIVPL